jgi:ribosomal protein S18 acetylase RimI-like enzyme
MEIRHAAPDDHAGCIVLEAEIQAQHHIGAPFMYPPTGVTSLEDYLSLLEKTDEKVLVAVDDGQVVGYLQYQLIERPANYYMYAEKLLYVVLLMVKETQRGKGIGEALIRRATEIAQDYGASRVTLEVWSFNEGAARFYERVGFTEIKKLMSMPLAEVTR